MKLTNDITNIDYIYYILNRWKSKYDLTKDDIQEIVIMVFQSTDSFDTEKGNLLPWVQIITKRFKYGQRNSGSINQRSLYDTYPISGWNTEDGANLIIEGLDSPYIDPLRALEIKEELEEVYRNLDRILPQYKDAILKSLTTEPVDTDLLFRARTALREKDFKARPYRVTDIDSGQVINLEKRLDVSNFLEFPKHSMKRYIDLGLVIKEKWFVEDEREGNMLSYEDIKNLPRKEYKVKLTNINTEEVFYFMKQTEIADKLGANKTYVSECKKKEKLLFGEWKIESF